jgi:glycosyltransferase involved in cell wall biosynthesis
LHLAVIVPTYRRPQLLGRCLDALESQTARADAVVVVHRAGDEATASVIARRPGLTTVEVDRPGVLTAMAAGISATDATLVAFTDDDAAPRPGWLAVVREHLSDATVGATGGRDVVDHPTQDGPLTSDVGRLTWWGAVTGNHHLGRGPARDVDVLKGVNMAFRRDALSLPSGLRGTGAQVDFEIACCLWAAKGGWRLVYDPAAIVDHTVGPRFGADRRARPDASAVSDAAYNRLAIFLSLRPGLGLRRAAFGILVGERTTPGLLRAAAAATRGERDVLLRLKPSLSGQAAAMLDVLRGRRVHMIAPR